MRRWLGRRGARPAEVRDLLIERVTRLQELTAALAVTATVDEVVAESVRSIQHAVGARAAAFCRVDGDTVRVAGSIGYEEPVVSQFLSFPLDHEIPIAVAIRTGAPVLCSTRYDALERFPQLADAVTLGDSQAIAALPLRGGGATVLGAIGMSFRDEHPFDADQVSFLVAAATQCATAFERAAAFEAEREARRAAEAANRRLEYLSEATVVLSQSLDPETTMQRLAELAVPTLGDWCAVHLVDGEFAYPVAMASEDPAATAVVRDLSNRHPVPIAAPAGLGAVVRTGQPVVVNAVTMNEVRAGSDEGEVVDLLSRLKSIVIVPMRFQDTVIGTVTLSNTTDRVVDRSTVSLAEELAARAAQAVTNARLYQERNRVASTLQASLLPPSPMIIPGVDIATRFVPSAEGLDVGGDFYDVFRLGTVHDPKQTWALVIGDVRGKGADAAAITGIARATIRAAALDETSPAAMLHLLNEVLLAAAQDDRTSVETSEPRFCTTCVVTVTPHALGAELVVAIGGHPRPYVVRATGEVEQIGTHGGLIGAIASPQVIDVTATMGLGDALVLYTDGVTERHEGRRFFDEEGLADVLDGCIGATAAQIADRIEQTARSFVDAKPKDDMAVVVARIPDAAPIGTLARRMLPDDERAAALARMFVAETLREHGADEIVDRAVLLTSELVTNALRHGAPTVTIDVLTATDGFRISVTDEHPGMPKPRVASHGDERGRGLLLVERLSRRWGVDAHPPGKAVWFEL